MYLLIMASIVKRKRKAGYEIRWIDAGRHRSKSFERKKDADLFMKAVSSGSGPANCPTLYIAAQNWLTEVHSTCRTLTYEHYKYVMKAACDDLGREVPISRVDQDVLMAYRDRLSSRLQAKTVNNHLRAIRAFFTFCMSRRWIDYNPVKLVKFPQYRSKIPRWLSEDESDALVEKLKKAPCHIRLALLLALRGGLRVGDLAALRWEDITEDSILVQEGKSKHPRIVPIHPDLRPILKEIPRVGPYIFPGRRGVETHLQAHKFGENLRLWLKESGFETSVHGLRHTFATQLAAAGATLTDLRQILGHTSITTSEIYLHSSTSRQSELVARLGQPRQGLRVLSA